jgi:hypothetical protein
MGTNTLTHNLWVALILKWLIILLAPDGVRLQHLQLLRSDASLHVPQSIEPIEFKVSFPKIHPSDPEKLGMEVFRDKN